MNFAASDTVDCSLYPTVNAVAIPFHGKLGEKKPFIIDEGISDRFPRSYRFVTWNLICQTYRILVLFSVIIICDVTLP